MTHFLHSFSFLSFDALSELMARAKATGTIKCYVIGNDGFSVNHLQFVNDTMCFCRVEEEQVRRLKDILIIFETIFGLKINIAKTTLEGIEVERDVLQLYARILGCKTDVWPINYLGLPLGGVSRSLSFWDPVIERINNKLASWKRLYISFGGRITLIKAVLSNLSIYYMFIFKMPTKVIKRVEKCQRDFLWEGRKEKKNHLVNWKDVCHPKSKDGLGIENIRERNLALMGK